MAGETAATALPGISAQAQENILGLQQITADNTATSKATMAAQSTMGNNDKMVTAVQKSANATGVR